MSSWLKQGIRLTKNIDIFELCAVVLKSVLHIFIHTIQTDIKFVCVAVEKTKLKLHVLWLQSSKGYIASFNNYALSVIIQIYLK